MKENSMTNYIEMLNDTLNILKKGKYFKNERKIKLKLSVRRMRKCRVYLPQDIRRIVESKQYSCVSAGESLAIGCKNTDSFSMASEHHRNGEKKILVLNFANPFNPGGGVRRGARAQEEDLCRKSSLLLSLESKEARKYYIYNLSLQSYLSSDAILITPDVEIIKNAEGNLLDETFVVSVMTCAAPIVTPNLEGLTKDQYAELFYHRICGMLVCAAHLGYRTLVLGAFGCGAFGNDAELISDLFCKAIREFDLGGCYAKDVFHRIDFAVLDRTETQYNFRAFQKNFD